MTRLLVADDVAENRYLLETLFEGNGYQVLSAKDGAEALTLAQGAPPDVVVTDILMPVMDGFELCRRWMADERLRGVPFVFYTATYTEPEDERFALSLGATRFVVKPQKPEVLLQVVREVLEGARQGGGAAAAKPLGEEMEVLRHYNEALFRKLERKVAQLQAETAERRRLEGEARELLAVARLEKERLTALVEASCDEIWFADARRRFTLITAAGRREFALAPGIDVDVEELAARLEVLRPDGSPRPVSEAPPLRALAGEVVRNQEEVVRTPATGELRYRQVSAAPVRDAAGALVGSVSVVRDITEQKRAEEALRAERLKLDTVTKNIGAGLAIISRDYRTVWANKVLTDIFGDVLGKPCHLTYNGQPAVCADCGVRRVFEEGVEVAVHEQSGKDAQGRVVWSQIVATPIRDETGHVAQALELVVPITERKLAEEQTRKLQAQLLQAQKMEAVGLLAGGVAHDFNNILSSTMLRLGELQNERGFEPATREALAELMAEAQRAAALTRQLLTFSRKSVLTIKPEDVNALVENLLKMLRRIIGEHVELRFDPAPGLPLAAADAGMLEQVLTNLVVNARDAMPDGGKLTLAATAVEFDAAAAASNPERLPGSFVCLAVTDTGHGMDQATLAHLFEPFFTTKGIGKGTGLGLPTIYGIAKQHRGWVEVESQPGAGSTFCVYVPVATGPRSQAAPVAAAGAAKGGHERILLVEDDQALRRVAARMLRGLGYEVLEAGNGNEALAVWAEHGRQVDLLLTDMVMPDRMSGLELAERLRKDRPGLKVIISSGYSSGIGPDGLPPAAGFAYLSKPYKRDALGALLRSCLDRTD